MKDTYILIYVIHYLRCMGYCRWLNDFYYMCLAHARACLFIYIFTYLYGCRSTSRLLPFLLSFSLLLWPFLDVQRCGDARRTDTDDMENKRRVKAGELRLLFSNYRIGLEVLELLLGLVLLFFDELFPLLFAAAHHQQQRYIEAV